MHENNENDEFKIYICKPIAHLNRPYIITAAYETGEYFQGEYFLLIDKQGECELHKGLFRVQNNDAFRTLTDGPIAWTMNESLFQARCNLQNIFNDISESYIFDDSLIKEQNKNMLVILPRYFAHSN